MIQLSNSAYIEPIYTIAKHLSAAKVPFHFQDFLSGAELTFPWCDGTVKCCQHSIGSDSGYVESYNFLWDRGTISMLDVDEAIRKIIDDYRYFKEREE